LLASFWLGCLRPVVDPALLFLENNEKEPPSGITYPWAALIISWQVYLVGLFRITFFFQKLMLLARWWAVSRNAKGEV